MPASLSITRLAPSPTGALHLGNARTFFINWLLARQNGWRIILRVEDLDGPRIKRGAGEMLLRDLAWLGIDWDEGPIYQSSRLNLYKQALDRLLNSGEAYPCICTRKEVEMSASAPHAEDRAAVYPGTCRGRFASVEAASAHAGRMPAIRFRVPDQIVEFDDAFRGRESFDVAQQLGDFVIAKGDGTPAYQLAVVVDDAAMGVTNVVRADDLIDSTPRQILLQRALGLSDRIPQYMHLPLVTGTDGRRLAKRHGDTRLSSYREHGVNAQRVVALLARWCGIDAGEHATARELMGRFELAALSHQPIIFTAEDDRWLLAGRREAHAKSGRP